MDDRQKQPTQGDGLSVRGCRGHFHVYASWIVNGEDEGDDIWIQGDPFKTREAAQAALEAYRTRDSTPSRAVPREEITLDAVKARRATDGLTRAWTTASERDIDWLLAAHQALTRERDAAVELSRIATLEHCRAENELTDFVDMHTAPSLAVPDEEPTLDENKARRAALLDAGIRGRRFEEIQARWVYDDAVRPEDVAWLIGERSRLLTELDALQAKFNAELEASIRNTEYWRQEAGKLRNTVSDNDLRG